MPPKKTEKGPSKKLDAKKAVEDRTFGMKNKKGGAAQKQISQLQSQMKAGGNAEQKKKEAEKAQREKEKKAAEDAKREAELLLNKPAQIQKVPFGVDPKTVLCIFHKKGNCEKGRKCKFSHDLELDRKTEKKSLYQDTRAEEDEKKKAETSADWDEEKLRSVVLSKKGNQRTTTDKVCKYFVQAIEDGKYGWFWICPNGGDKCMYKHALPPGFILKTKEQRAAEKALMDKSPLKTLTLEEFLESERHKLVGTLTPVTPESFAEWKKKRMDKKAAEEQARKAKEATGRTLFESGNWRGADDDESEDDEDDDIWNLQKMREETERLRQRKEDERLAKEYGIPYLNGEPVSGDATAEEAAQAAQPPGASEAPAATEEEEATAAT
ncbi:translation machinery-associated protein 46 [Diaporthe amygdali]|uniref:translation machinery-associated protein 46 n=1 Tax=Phomopsis amygdali TaxID=1214568 RepID=UPI0022FE8567|nr:translation machinery-associated protein 46 [Diaporthe amygdali]KAJ0125460.1 translation machinery-associated protein 46 [Diaporthe amygdali]